MLASAFDDLGKPIGVIHRRDIVRERSHFVHLAAGPAIVRMIVALSTSDARAGENPQRVGHVVERHGAVAEVVADGAVAALPAATRGGNQLAHELVVRLVGGERVLDPEDVKRAADAVVGVLHAEDVGPVVVLVADMTGRLQKRRDQLRALIRFLRRQKLASLVERGDAPDCIEVDAAKELFVACDRQRLDLFFTKLGIDEAIDFARRGLLVDNWRRTRRAFRQRVAARQEDQPKAAAPESQTNGGEFA